MADSDKIEAAVFRRLLQHLDERKDVQNIDLMIQAGFCRNCLAKWYMAAAGEQGLSIDYDQAREHINLGPKLFSDAFFNECFNTSIPVLRFAPLIQSFH